MRKLTFAILLTLALGPSCGGDSASPTQDDARDRATAASCDYYMRCGEIGAGKKYETRNDCEIEVRSGWNQAWPPAECDNKINGAELDVCLQAIGITSCDNPLDILNTLANKCAKAKICGGGADAGADK